MTAPKLMLIGDGLAYHALHIAHERTQEVKRGIIFLADCQVAAQASSPYWTKRLHEVQSVVGNLDILIVLLGMMDCAMQKPAWPETSILGILDQLDDSAHVFWPMVQEGHRAWAQGADLEQVRRFNQALLAVANEEPNLHAIPSFKDESAVDLFTRIFLEIDVEALSGI